MRSNILAAVTNSRLLYATMGSMAALEGPRCVFASIGGLGLQAVVF